jgi:hypothetical protein
MIWDLFKVYDVKRMFSQSTHDDLSLSRMPLDIAKTYVAEQLQMYGKRTLNVKLHMADIRVNVEREAVLPYTKLTASWHPSTTAVEFRNGPHDGELMVMEPRLLFSRFYFAVLHRSAIEIGPDALYPVVATEHLAYDYDGWDEDARRWIYRLCK